MFWPQKSRDTFMGLQFGNSFSWKSSRHCNFSLGPNRLQSRSGIFTENIKAALPPCIRSSRDRLVFQSIGTVQIHIPNRILWSWCNGICLASGPDNGRYVYVNTKAGQARFLCGDSAYFWDSVADSGCWSLGNSLAAGQDEEVLLDGHLAPGVSHK